jgi:4-diphosphocytidyl-2-C-methyl-D-erythritol kinase
MHATANESPLRIFAPAKINWILTVEKKRQDGYHDIHTVFQTLSWGDELRCRPLPDPVCRIQCNDPAVPTGAENLIARTWRLLAEACPGRVGGLQVELRKRIPAGAGLGGGSSDAAAALLALDRLYQLRLNRPQMEHYAAQIGSDCAFFIRGGTAVGTGRGEHLAPVPSRLPPLWLVVVFPGFHSSTAEAYRRIQPEHWENGRATAQVVSAIERGELSILRSLSRNVFNTIAIGSDMRYKTLKDRLLQEGLNDPMLSGSGSAMFAYADSPSHARQASCHLMRVYPLAFGARPRRTGIGVLST